MKYFSLTMLLCIHQLHGMEQEPVYLLDRETKSVLGGKIDTPSAQIQQTDGKFYTQCNFPQYNNEKNLLVLKERRTPAAQAYAISILTHAIPFSQNSEHALLPEGHGTHVNDCSFSSNGAQIAVAPGAYSRGKKLLSRIAFWKPSLAYDVFVWNPENGQDLKSLEGHSDTVFSVCFNPADPCILASGSCDKTIKIWNTTTTECLSTYAASGTPVSIAYRPDGNQIAWWINANGASYAQLLTTKNSCIQDVQLDFITQYIDGTLAYSADGTVLAASPNPVISINFYSSETGDFLASLNLDPWKNLLSDINASSFLNLNSKSNELIIIDAHAHVVKFNLSNVKTAQEKIESSLSLDDFTTLMKFADDVELNEEEKAALKAWGFDV